MPNKWNPFNSFNQQQTNLDLELLKKEVGQRFPFYDMKYNVKTAAFYINLNKDDLEKKFDDLRKSLSKKGYIPLLREEGGEDLIYIIKKSDKKTKPVWVNSLLLIATVITTVLTGSIIYMGYFDIWSIPTILDVFKPVNLFYGALLFALPLLSILLVHEMGHYFISKKHGIETSLPYLMPIPPILPNFNIGTFGAIISSREPMHDKKALFDVGISGPVAGFIVALPVTAIGIANSEIVDVGQVASGEPILGMSLLFMLLSEVLLNIPQGFGLSLNPVAFAGWVGLLITSINLLPAGQLDGGHIFRAVFGEKQKYIGWAAVAIMIFTGWWFFAFVIILMMGGAKHPPPLNDHTPLDIRRKLFFLVAVVVLFLCYIPWPISVT
ncbi:MAG: site-2 protease family protein [Candidatus Thermoplasmatota archaeon]